MYRFNGAALRRARSDGLLPKFTRMPNGFNGAALRRARSAPPLHPRGASPVASTGPRSGERGVVDRFRNGGREVIASTGPRSGERGVAGRRGRTPHYRRRFNGAALRRARSDPLVLPNLCNSLPLQRGRAPESAECPAFYLLAGGGCGRGFASAFTFSLTKNRILNAEMTEPILS